MPRLNVFISYAHKDDDYFEVFKDGLKTHLYNSSQYDFGTWEDSKIHVGSFWDAAIKQNVQECDIAVLCVSGNFLQSKYIKNEEFRLLRAPGSKTLICPVYFNHCNIEAWQTLSGIQFFKPDGDDYDNPTSTDFAFCDLVRFTTTHKELIPNSNIDLYILNFVRRIESALAAAETELVGGVLAGAATSSGTGPFPAPPPKEKKSPVSLDKLVTILIIAAIALSLGLIFFFLFKPDDGDHFKVYVSVAMFFGSIAAFVFNRRNVQLKRP